jgi:hypothetical protein
MTSKGVACTITAGVIATIFLIVVLCGWLGHDTPTYECWTPTHIELKGTDSIMYTSDGQRIDPNNHEGLFVEGRPWCGEVGHSIAAWLPWIEDNQAPAQVHTSG